MRRRSCKKRRGNCLIKGELPPSKLDRKNGGVGVGGGVKWSLWSFFVHSLHCATLICILPACICGSRLDQKCSLQYNVLCWYYCTTDTRLCIRILDNFSFKNFLHLQVLVVGEKKNNAIFVILMFPAVFTLTKKPVFLRLCQLK